MNQRREIKDGILYFDGCSTVDLAKQYGTPLYVMSEGDIEDKMREIKTCFLDKYPNTRAAYASKAFCTMAIYKICEKEGFCIDIVSGGELHTAIKAGFPAERIEFNGNNKLPHEIEEALDYGIGRFIVDGLQEVALIEAICKEKGKTANILFRVTPGVAASTHDYITTGKKDSKFGIPLDEDVFFPQVEAAIKAEHLNFLGLHFHVGSQLFDNAPFLQALDIILDKVAEIKKRFDYDIKELNLGGGFGIKYTDCDHPQPYNAYMSTVAKAVKAKAKEYDMPVPFICLEPGRSIVGESGITLYTVGSVKVIPKIRTYVSIDGGMTDNPRYALYKSSYLAVIADKAGQPAVEKVTIAGKCCESGDLIQEDAMIQEAAPGDTLAVFSTGAYNYSMSSNYNRIPKPPIVMVKAGSSRVIVKRETYDDLIKNDV